MFDKEIGVRGGEVTFSAISEFWGASDGPETRGIFSFWPLEGVEKLRGTACRGNGNRDAVLDTTNLFVAERLGPLATKGAEWPIKLEGLEGFKVKLEGGLGSSWSSFILGDDKKGEAIGDTLGGDDDDDRCGIWLRKRGPENNWGCVTETKGSLADKPGLVDHGFLVNGPEKAYLLTFLVSETTLEFIIRNGSPSTKGGGSPLDTWLVLLSLSTDCAFMAVDSKTLSSPKIFSYFGSKGEECHKLWGRPLKLVGIGRESGLSDLVGAELFVSSGVGST